MKKLTLSVFIVCYSLICFSQTKEIDTIRPFKLIKDPTNNKASFLLSENTNQGYVITQKRHIDLVQKSISSNSSLIIGYDPSLEKVISLTPGPRLKKMPNFKLKEKKANKKILPDVLPIDSLDLLFAAMVDAGCNGDCDPRATCLTFKYKINGCNARAHWMSKILEEKYGYTSKKIFSSGKLKAINNDGCGNACITWGWHVAPLVTVAMTDGSREQMVIDPSLFSKPVTIREWNATMEQSCSATGTKGKVVKTEILDREIYTPNGNTDPDYYDTVRLLRKFCKKCAN